MPITMLICFLLPYYGLYYSMLIIIWMFSFNWILLLFGYSIFIGIITFFVSSLPAIFSFLILKLYKMNWFSVISHSFAGLLGVILFYYFIYQFPPELVSGNETTPILKGMWNQSWFKTLLLIFPFIGLQLGILYQSILGPIIIKLDDE